MTKNEPAWTFLLCLATVCFACESDNAFDSNEPENPTHEPAGLAGAGGVAGSHSGSAGGSPDGPDRDGSVDTARAGASSSTAGQASVGDTDGGTNDAPMGTDVEDDAGSEFPPEIPLVPSVETSFQLVYRPSGGRYLNDHTVVKDRQGLWHVLGITHVGEGSPQEERTFLHATTRSLLSSWSEESDALVASAAANERVLWAPHVVETESNRWTMFYYSSMIQPEEPARGLRRAESQDLRSWSRVEQSPNASMRPPGGRDPYLYRSGDHWLLYSVGVSRGHGQILVSRNNGSDFSSGWTQEHPVIEDPMSSYSWGNLESPTVVRIAGYYYLFLTRTGDDVADSYTRTLVFRSTNPENFSWEPVAQLKAHAAELVQDGADWYLTSAGWPSGIGEQNRGLSIAPLLWHPADE